MIRHTPHGLLYFNLRKAKRRTSNTEFRNYSFVCQHHSVFLLSKRKVLEQTKCFKRGLSEMPEMMLCLPVLELELDTDEPPLLALPLDVQVQVLQLLDGRSLARYAECTSKQFACAVSCEMSELWAALYDAEVLSAPELPSPPTLDEQPAFVRPSPLHGSFVLDTKEASERSTRTAFAPPFHATRTPHPSHSGTLLRACARRVGLRAWMECPRTPMPMLRPAEPPCR